MHDPTPVPAGARALAGRALRLRRRAAGWDVLRPYLDAVSALAAVLFLMSAADLDTPVPYLCGAAALLAALGAELAR
ncbi:MAG TPA: hypothetical protein VGL20_11510 [Candidatus Dormibacteraeota bacterium]|jgi:hypothetical protein